MRTVPTLPAEGLGEPLNGQTVTADRLSESELTYHRRVVEQAKQAQVLMAPWQHWSQYLAEAYQIGPADTITEDGLIVRGQTAPPAGAQG